MPLYEYRCEDCGHRFEILQRLGEGAGELACPQCGKERLEKQFSTFASAAADTSERCPAAGSCQAGAT